MEKIRLILSGLIGVFVGFSVFGQVEIKNMSLENPSQYLMYRNFYNQLEVVTMEGFELQQIVIEGDSLERNMNTVFVSPQTNQSTLLVDVISKLGDTVSIGYKILNLPFPELMLGELKGGNLDRALLLSNPGILFDFPADNQLPFIYPVKADLVLTTVKGKKEVMQVNGNAFSDKQLKKLSKLEVGTTLTFQNVRSSCKFCEESGTLATSTFTLIN